MPAATRHSGEPVVLCTHAANDGAMRLAAKLGFTEVERFEEDGAENWVGMWSSVTLDAGAEGQSERQRRQ